MSTAGEGWRVVNFLMSEAAKHGVDWMPYLPAGKTTYTAREVTNAIGEALTAAGVPNNLKKAMAKAEEKP